MLAVAAVAAVAVASLPARAPGAHSWLGRDQCVSFWIITVYAQGSEVSRVGDAHRGPVADKSLQRGRSGRARQQLAGQRGRVPELEVRRDGGRDAVCRPVHRATFFSFFKKKKKKTRVALCEEAKWG